MRLTRNKVTNVKVQLSIPPGVVVVDVPDVIAGQLIPAGFVPSEVVTVSAPPKVTVDDPEPKKPAKATKKA